MRLSLIFISILYYNLNFGQNKVAVLINEKLYSPPNKHTSTIVEFKAYDNIRKERLPILMVRLNNMTVTLSDTTSHHIFLKSGTYKISFGWVGYKWTEPKRIKVSLTKEYELTVFMEETNEELY